MPYFRSFCRVSVICAFLAVASASRAELTTAGTLYVDLRASDVSAGSATWQNTGTLTNFSATGAPSLTADVSGTGVPGVFFDGIDDAYIGPNAGPDLEGASNRTIEVWILNPTLDSNEETLVALGERGTLRGNTSLNHGVSSDFGGATHWNDDAGWLASVPSEGEWHHLVYTYDGKTTVRLYADGALNTSAVLGGPLATLPNTINLAVQRRFDDPTTLAFLNEFDTTQMAFSGYVNTVRIHGGVLDAAGVQNNFQAGPAGLGPPSGAPPVSGVSPDRGVFGFAFEKHCADFAEDDQCNSTQGPPVAGKIAGAIGSDSVDIAAGGEVSISTISSGANVTEDPQGLPTVRVAVTTGNDSFAQGLAWGVQRYRWKGPTASLEFGGIVTYSQSSQCFDNLFPGEGCVDVLVDARGPTWDPLGNCPNDSPIWALSCTTAEDIIVPGVVEFADPIGSPGSFEASLVIPVEPDYEFYLAATLTANAFRGGTADAGSTFTPFVSASSLTEEDVRGFLQPIVYDAYPTIYADPAVFNAAIAEPTVIDFEDFAPPGGATFFGDPGSFSDQGITITNNSVMFVQNNNLYGTGAFLSPQQQAPQIVEIVLPPNTRALAFSYQVNSTAFIIFDGGSIISLPSVPFGTLKFIGFTGDNPIDKFRLSSASSGFDLDNLIFAPEPGSASAVFASLLTLAGIAWRRRAGERASRL